MAHAATKTSASFHRQERPNSPRRLSRDQRRRIEETVAFLIDVLDEADGDPNLEPSLGWSKTYATCPADTDAATADRDDNATE